MVSSLKHQGRKPAGNYAQQGIKSLLTLMLVIGVMVSSLMFSGCGLFKASENTKTPESMAAEELYLEAWEIIREEFVDPTYNEQDWYKRWHHKYRGELRDKEDAYVAIQTMLASLNDDYTRFLKPRDREEQDMSIDSKLYGIGVQISKKDGKLMVVTTFDDTPADKAGLLPKDVITHIDGEETAALSVEDAADRIRGKENTLVKITVKRIDEDGKTELFSRDILRGEIKIHTVFTKELKNPEIGYIRLSSFISESAMPELMNKIEQQSGKKAMILDLRGNYGGLLSNAVDVADLFLEEGDIVSMVDNHKDKKVFRANPGQWKDVPMVVLIDGGSASASEIVSGALKDHKRATLVGTRTFGKGLVQKINTLSDGSGINITISKYFTPKGTDINKKGIEPDIQVEYTQDDFLKGRDPQLDKAITVLQKKYRLASADK